MAANTFTLQVNVASDQVQLLKNAGYSLCISKKVNGSYCVVWQGTGFNAHNTFRWTEEYRVFACNQFKTGALVEASCEPVDIQFGQTAILDETGTMLPAQGPVTGESFAVTNLYQPVNFAVNQYIGSSWSPIYVDKTLTVIGDDPSETFTPIVSVLVWFSKSLTTSSMFTTASSSSIEAVYRGQVTQTVSYDDTGVNGNGMWFLGTKVTGFTAVPPRSYSGDKGFVNLSHANDAFAVAAIVNKFTDAQGDDQGGTGTTVGSQATGRVGIAPPKCPMTAIMSFQNDDAQSLMLAAINKGNATGQWPRSVQGLTIGAPNLIGNKISVMIDTVPKGGASGPAEAKWTAFASQWTQDVKYV